MSRVTNCGARANAAALNHQVRAQNIFAKGGKRGLTLRQDAILYSGVVVGELVSGFHLSEAWKRSPLGGFSERFIGKRDACIPKRGYTKLQPVLLIHVHERLMG